MKKTGKIKITEIADKAACKYFVKKCKNYPECNFETIEKRNLKIKSIKFRILFIAASYGVLGVILLYLPKYIFPEIFPQTPYTIPYINYTFDISIPELIYGFILVAIEIWLLLLGDIKSVGEIASAYGYSPEKDFNNFSDETTELVYIGMGKDRKKVVEVGINPFQNISKTGVALLRLFFMIKAFLSNLVFKFIIKRVLGRLTIRAVIDLAGIPIYAFWNAYASSVVLRKANMRMLARDEMLKTGYRFYKKFADNKQFCNLIYDTLGYVAITKKNFYPSDYIFAKHFLTLFKIKIEKEHILSKNYFETLIACESDVQLAIGQLLAIGFLIDGKIGSLEVRVLKNLKMKNIIPYNIDDIKIWTKQYIKGKGFDAMFSAC